jgi:dihydroorotate dehydrogenase
LPALYQLFFRLVLRHLPAEWVHQVAFALLRLAGAVPGMRAWWRRWLAPRSPALRVKALGLDFAGPVGLAAGFDKDARAYRTLGALGFGFVEVGTVTPQPQAGNPRPRMWRLPADRALLNRLGFNNQGMEVAARRLGGRGGRGGDGAVICGVNIGKQRTTAVENATGDYVAAAERLGPLADYLVVNVSSPNTPGLRALQQVDTLRGLLAAVRAALDRASGERRVPLLVKIDPDLPDAEIDGLAALALELGLDGIIATNTTVTAQQLRSPVDLVGSPPRGGISGAPLKARSLAVLQRLRALVGDRLVLISVGGVETVDDVWQRLGAGASLVQLYTSFIYQGPLHPARLHRQLAARLRAAGLDSVSQLIGREVDPGSGATASRQAGR